MFLRFQTLMLALIVAVLVVLGAVSLFIAETSSLPSILIEAQTYDPGY